MSNSGPLHERYARVFARADLGDPVQVWYRDGAAMTDLGAVWMPVAKDRSHMQNVGPVVLIRHFHGPRPNAFQIAGRGVFKVKSALKFDKEKRLYLMVTADNGSWTWQLRRAEASRTHFQLDNADLYVGVWRD